MKKALYLLVTLTLCTSFVPQVKAGTTMTSGTNYVNVASCHTISDGIMIQRLGNAHTYKLSNGIRDAGYGLRDYVFMCTSHNQYRVRWSTPDTQQPKIEWFRIFETNTQGIPINTLTTQYSSYQDYAYGSLPYPVEIENEQEHFRLQVRLTNESYKNAEKYNQDITYGLAWKTSDSNNLIFDESTLKRLVGNASTSLNHQTNLSLTDWYRGKYVAVFAFVSNNDGISHVPNMPIEVDDIIPLYFHIKPNLDVVNMSCGNSSGGDGLYSGCTGDTISHSSGLSVTINSYSNTRAYFTFHGIKRTVAGVDLGRNVYILSRSGQWVRISFDYTSDKYGIFTRLTTVN